MYVKENKMSLGLPCSFITKHFLTRQLCLNKSPAHHALNRGTTTSMNSALLLTSALLFSGGASAASIALKNVNIVDVNKLSIKQNQTILIEDNRITQISGKKLRLKSDVTVVDLTDKYIIPGFIDTHVHHATVPDTSDSDAITRMRLRHLLQGGVTSIRDMGGDVRVLSSLKRRAEINMIQSPDIYYSVIIGGSEFFSDPRTIESALGRTPGNVDWMRSVDENSNFDEVILRAQGTGATGIKIYAKVSADVITKLQQAAKRHGMKVWAHAYVGPAKPEELVNAGVETISHAPDLSAHVVENFYELRRKGEHITNAQRQESFELARYTPLIEAMKTNGTILDATLTVFEMNQTQRGERGRLMNDWGNTFTRLAHENGILVSTGTDSASDYHNHDMPLVHHEMQLLVNHAGFTPLEAIQSATINGAKVIGIEDNVGDIAVGKVANLVILNQNPSDDIALAKDIAHVIKNGQFVYRGNNPDLPFVDAIEAAGMLYLSGQIGNLPGTKVLVGDDISKQMTQAMKNIGDVLQQHELTYNDIVKCTLMLDDIDEWQQANEAYMPFFETFPTRSAYGTSGLALNAKVEVECIAKL